jgi:tetratricopeptide (TPR) repeat protein
VNPVLNLGRNQIRALSQVLSKHLSRTAHGQEIIQVFGKNNESGRAVLFEYLKAHLPENPGLQSQIKAALGDEAGGRFTTIVTDGAYVDQIFNIKELESLSIRYYFFQDIWQVITFLLGVVVIGGMISLGYWWFQQPRIMTGDFNIAVAEFVPRGDANDIAPIVSQRIFSFLDGQYLLSSFQDVQVEHDKIGVISSAEAARALADKIRAHVVIYGDVTVVNDQVLVTPQFYVVQSYQADVGEVNGEHKLAVPISLLVKDLFNPSSEALKIMQQNARILTEFTKALVYLAAGEPGDLILAAESINKAIAEAERHDDFMGKEVVYLFASDIARRQGNLEEAQEYLDESLRLNKNYGRGYIAQANIYYDNGDLYQAIQNYEKAKQLTDQPFGAYIVEKASLGIGHSCWIQFQYVIRDGGADQSGSYDLAKCALDNYQTVIQSFAFQENPETNLQEMAAWAYYDSGTIYHNRGQIQVAQELYEQALNITKDPKLIRRAQASLEEVK